jgi:hypothetical protein
MRRLGAAVLLALTTLAAACSGGGQPVTALGTADQPAKTACAAFRDLERLQASGAMATPALRAKIAEVYNDASTSSMPIVRARAVALYADATVMATGGEAPSLNQDIASMSQACTGI